MTTPEISAEATLNDTLKLLEEVSAYLKRLPHVPITAELVRKLDAHLQTPETMSARRLAEEHERAQRARGAAILSPLGVPLVELEVYADRVKIQITPVEQFQGHAFQRLVSREFIELPLGPPREGGSVFRRRKPPQ
ncbi:hypothetical protein LJR129_004906 [Acidovorax sp. LjRoot129]|uniref:hypothetical protein n=1 Tax=unclassified Acidovorax TaxID=2684926 RepID=UPI003ECE699E